MAEMVGGDSDAASIAIWAALTYDIISATNSSPQTTEINAKTRAGTLMKWVHIGLIQAVGFAILGVIVERPGKRWRPVVGVGLAGSLLYGQYVHARNMGVASNLPGTETDWSVP